MSLRNSWLQRNWIALWAVSCFLAAALEATKWLAFRSEDAALESVFNLLVGIAFVFQHKRRKEEETYQDARKQLTDALESKR